MSDDRSSCRPSADGVLRDRGRPAAQRPRPRRREQERRAADPRRVPAHRRAGDAARTCRASATSRRWSSCSPTSAPTSSGSGRTRCASTPPTSTRRSSTRSSAAGCAPRSCSPARCSRASARVSVPPPGGDVIGRRRLDPHIHAFAELGARDRASDGRYEMRADGAARQARLPRRGERDGDRERGHGRRARAGRDGRSATPPASRTSRISAASSSRSARRSRASSSNVLRIDGVESLRGGEWRIGPEHIEVGELHRPRRGHRRRRHDRRTSSPSDLVSILPAFERLGVRVEVGGTSVRVPPGQELVIQDDLGGADPEDRGRPVAGVPGRPDVDRRHGRDAGARARS